MRLLAYVLDGGLAGLWGSLDGDSRIAGGHGVLSTLDPPPQRVDIVLPWRSLIPHHAPPIRILLRVFRDPGQKDPGVAIPDFGMLPKGPPHGETSVPARVSGSW